MRVSGGSLRGRRLVTFRGGRIRPTSDMVREAVFNIIACRLAVEGASVLDLFAGTGAMAIEALSRGAKRAVLVDSDARAVAVIKRNLESCSLTGAARVVRADALEAVRRLAKRGESFDIVFIDPPYESSLLEKTVRAVLKGKLARPGGLVVAETWTKNPLPPEIEGVRVSDERRYGQTAVYFYEIPDLQMTGR